MTSAPLRTFVSDVSAVVDSGIRQIARDREMAEGWNVQVTMRLSHPMSFHIERKGCGVPTILVAFDYATRLLEEGTPSEKARRMADFRKRSVLAIRWANAMARANPLITGDQARQIRADRMALRRVPVFAGTDALPARYFTTSATVTVRCELSGRTRTADVPFGGSYEATEAMLRNILSRELLLDDVHADLVDAIEGARTPGHDDTPHSVTINTVPDGHHTIISYIPDLHVQADA